MNQLELFTEPSISDRPTLERAYSDAKKNLGKRIPKIENIKVPSHDALLDDFRDGVKYLIYHEPTVSDAFEDLIDALNKGNKGNIVFDSNNTLDFYCLTVILRPLNNILIGDFLDRNWMSKELNRFSEVIKNLNNP